MWASLKWGGGAEQNAYNIDLPLHPHKKLDGFFLFKLSSRENSSIKFQTFGRTQITFLIHNEKLELNWD